MSWEVGQKGAVKGEKRVCQNWQSFEMGDMIGYISVPCGDTSPEKFPNKAVAPFLVEVRAPHYSDKDINLGGFT